MASGEIKLPPGFQLEQSQPSSIKLPPGFQLEGGDSQPQETFMGNAVNDAKGIAGGLGYLAKSIGNVPQDYVQTGQQMMQGQPFSGTPLAQNYRTIGNVVKNAPQALFSRAKEVATHPIDSFYKKPISTALDIASVALPAGEALGATKLFGRAGETVNAARTGAADYLSETAASQAAKAAGFGPAAFAADEAPNTLKVGRYLKDEGIVGPVNSSKSMFNRLLKAESGSVQNMNGAVDELDKLGFQGSSGKQIAAQIRTQLQKKLLGDLPPENQALAMKGETGSTLDIKGKAIERIAKTAELYGDKPMPLSKQLALKRELYGVANYDSESRALRIPKSAGTIARQNLATEVGGASEMAGKPGIASMFNKGNADYGKIQDAKDVIGKQIGKETASSAFPMSDAVHAVAGAELGGGPGAAALYAVKKGYGAYGNQLGSYSADLLSKLLRKNPEAFGKYYQALENAAAKGTQALTAAHESIQQSDPGYNEVLKNLPGKPKPQPGLFKKSAKVLDEKRALAFLDQTNGDKEKARELAKAQGYEIPIA